MLTILRKFILGRLRGTEGEGAEVAAVEFQGMHAIKTGYGDYRDLY